MATIERGGPAAAPRDVRASVEGAWRAESARVVAVLVRMLRDVDLAEELAQDALVAALEKWPRDGVPDNPGAWLMAAAKNRGIDHLRRNKLLQRKHEELAFELESAHEDAPRPEDDADDAIGDDLLRLVFIACHPKLSREAQVALTLRLLGGLTTDEIARAFLVPEPTIAQRIVRAKRTLGESAAAFEEPRAVDLRARLDPVLAVLYLVFNEGYAATAGDDWIRPQLCAEALRLGRLVAGLVPGEAEAQGLLALMALQASRLQARVAEDGTPILLADQDRARWDRALVAEGLASLARAQALDAGGPYALQAAIAACHARAGSTEETDWARIASLYAALAQAAPSPVVELNRAVAVSMADGPAAGLAIVDAIADAPALKQYHLLPAVRGDLLAKLGRDAEARAEFERGAGLARNARERELLLARAAAAKK
jgi:RNA polymerase sigma factor (sigma-70 family)